MGAHKFKASQRRSDVCKTPEAVYTTALDPNSIRLDVDLPVSMLNPDSEKSLIQDLHLAILPVIEKLYRDRWHLLAGKVLKSDPKPLPSTWQEL
jgi:hypothetical protein